MLFWNFDINFDMPRKLKNGGAVSEWKQTNIFTLAYDTLE